MSEEKEMNVHLSSILPLGYLILSFRQSPKGIAYKHFTTAPDVGQITPVHSNEKRFKIW